MNNLADLYLERNLDYNMRRADIRAENLGRLQAQFTLTQSDGYIYMQGSSALEPDSGQGARAEKTNWSWLDGQTGGLV